MSLLAPPSTPRPRYHPLTVSEVRHPVPGSVVLTFAVPDDLVGTYLRFRAGQYLTIRAVVKGEEVRQSYSIYISPAKARREQALQIAASEVPGGRMSPWLVHEVTAGDVLDVLPAMGDFVAEGPARASERHVAIAGGSGVTPVLSVVTDLIEQGADHRITVVLSHRDPLSAIGLEDLLAVQAEHPTQLTVVPLWTREAPSGETVGGRLTRERLASLLGVGAEEGALAGAADQWWICGPAGLVEGAERWLADDGVEPAAVHTEVFTSSAEPT